MNVTDPYSGREQTEAKHFILRRYLQALAFKVLTFQDITYVDGFSGPWETKTENFSDSSFMIAISVLLDVQKQYQERTRVRRKIRCFFSVKTASERLAVKRQNTRAGGRFAAVQVCGVFAKDLLDFRWVKPLQNITDRRARGRPLPTDLERLVQPSPVRLDERANAPV